MTSIAIYSFWDQDCEDIENVMNGTELSLWQMRKGLQIASLGISTYAVRECSKCRDDKEKLDQIAGQIYSINVCSTILSYFMLVLLLLFSEPLSGYRSLICIQSMTILFTTIGTDWINTVFEDFKYITMPVKMNSR